MSEPHAGRPFRSVALVALQFALIALLLPGLRAEWPPIPALGLLATAVALGVATLVANRPGNFNIRPDVKQGGRLVTTGPYAHVRHPMYVTVLLAGAAVLVWQPTWWRAGVLVALAVVLHAKAVVEETAMARAHPDYAAYRARTARWFPGLW